LTTEQAIAGRMLVLRKARASITWCGSSSWGKQTYLVDL